MSESKRPVTHREEAEMRLGNHRPLPDVFDVGRRTRDALIALLDYERDRTDEAETWCARLANDRECERALIQIGVAKALAAIRAVYDRQVGVERTASLGEAIRAMERECGPASLPPHEVTLARLRRLEEALAAMIACWDGGKFPSQWMGLDAGTIARRVLET